MSCRTWSSLRVVKSACVFTVLCYIISACFIKSTHGGLLSAYLRTKNFHYVVQRVNDYIDMNNDSSEISDVRNAINHKGTPTSSSVKVGTSYVDCGSVANIKSLTLSPCSNKEILENAGEITSSSICEIERGSNATFDLSFVPKANATQLKASIHGIIDYVPIPFPCPEPNACKNSGISCPILAGKQYHYTLSAPIKNSYPRMKLWVKGQLEDDDGTNVICVKIHVHII